MNEGTKTGLFWVVAVVMLAVAVFVAWPTSTDSGEDTFVGQILFEQFTDPEAAASMKIVTFNEEKGQLRTFEVRKNAESGLWTIPSRDGYPADAFDQMKEAATALVGLKILDTQTSNAEDHDDLGVAEPKLEDLEVGDEGVGRLVSFKDESQETLASLIIGDPLDDDPEKRYVRIPGQDPVYVVKLDDSPLTTQFQDWIEDDLLQLSSIDIADMEIKDYSAAINANGQIELARNYIATVKMDGPQWVLDSLLEYDPKNAMADPAPVQVDQDEKLNKARLDAIKNALDDLKIVDVVRKPDGLSANLRANQDLLSDKDAVASLAQRGFYPVPSGPAGEMELLSANGELNVALRNGVKYVMRFGNIAGVTEDEDVAAGAETGDVAAGVNRYLLVTTMVDESKFPVPDLKAPPQTLEDLDAILKAEKEASQAGVDQDVANESAAATEGEPAATTESKPAAEPASELPAGATGDASSEVPSQAEPDDAEEAAPEQPTAASGETETSGQGETTGSGAGQAPVDQQSQAKDDVAPDDEKLSEEERWERLEAEQEKITKENQRKLDARKDRLEAAERQSRALNERFADWYYVIPEDTYSQLRIKRDQLFQQPSSAAGAVTPPLDAPPQFSFPAVPPGN